MPRPLTKAERYQFGLTGSKARTLAAQRAAIARHGLVDATLQEKLGATGEIGAVRADYLLGLRRDNYVTRACQVALLRR